MNITEKGIQRIAFTTSMVFHILLLLITIPLLRVNIEVTARPLRIPVRMIYQKQSLPTVSPKIKQPALEKKNLEPVSRKTYAEEHTTGKTVKAGGIPGDREAPVIDKSFTPVYPKEALNNNWSGTVDLDVDISETGLPIAQRIIKSSGYEVLDESLIRTIKTYYKFKPRRIMGKDTAGTIRVTYTFKLEE